MPELPEVETTRAGIEPHVRGQTVRTVVVRQPQLRWPVSPELAAVLPGQAIHTVHRRAKYLLFETDTGHVCLHLGMSGRLRIVPADTPVATHDHLDIVLENDWAIRFNDTRRFGSVFWLEGAPETFSLLAHLGPEPLGDAFDGDWLYARSRGKRASVKTFIMDSATVVGVGNIYACEALHAARIHPRRPAGRVGRARYRALAEAIRRVLADAIVAGGTTLRNYIGVDGDTGYFQLRLAAYGKAGQACPRGCGPIRREVIGQRSTFFCPVCQK
ncbi:bifunctional DNA-formamidopyrimidine glycosylase/DNA-(apurinic or apyrimidinic site) lyase [Salinisphaera sp.]|uniref:bifunctional DNA-formamidopyrimidine glycosylase/DNA-(apurinic or apyrimidinic site) lyase n=1 Tax=Salinisphaera sp. TaxID=1914330 RepID=UPI000C41BB2F|nr:bifunctional DNA-formamidopyrimidine glycosylase/DNA-(apurinic or apyrimidinic site) lyase [Salinisphaera sp.]MAS10262.1 DNA-formamidopyrimidine glycosylase [Salinisphaera sp.]